MNNLIRLMQVELDLYLKLNDILDDEQKALVHRNISKIEICAERKLGILDKIRKATNERLSYLKDELGEDIGSSFSFATWLAQNDQDALKLWLDLEAVVINTKSINDANSTFITKYLSETREALDLLGDGGFNYSYDKSGTSSYSTDLNRKYKA